MRRSPNQDKALIWYIEANQLTPQLSAYPTYRFLDKDGVETNRHIFTITSDWKKWRKQEKKVTRIY